MKLFYVSFAICLGLLDSVTQAGASGSNVTTIGQCVFYGDQQTYCRGRLRCKPSDFKTTSGYGEEDQEQQQSQPQLPDLEQVCPGVDEASNGTWKVSQGIVPEQYAEVRYPAEVVATCYFRTNGTFYCKGGSVWPDTFWEGLFSGTLNSAFELGLDRWYFKQVQRTTTTPSPTTTTRQSWVVAAGRGRFGDDKGGDDEQERTDDRRRDRRPEEDFASANDNDDSYPARQQEPSSFTDLSGPAITTSDTENDQEGLQRVSGTRDAVNRYDAQRAAEQNSNSEHVTFTVGPQRVFVCEYFNNGQVGCRNCTEKVFRIVLETGENGNRRDYNCSQPRSGPIQKRWNSDNGIIPLTPEPHVAVRRVVATCIFEKSARTYECHGDSALCPDETGNRVHTNKCLGGKRWSGDYTGDFGYLS